MDLISILTNLGNDPITYSALFFIYVILAAIILPIPVEIGLFNPLIHPVILIAILAVGKGVGAFIVFTIGSKIRKVLKGASIGEEWKITKRIITASEKFVLKYGHYGLFIIMSIPLMVDSITLYLFSLLNPKEEQDQALNGTKFVLINIGAGAVRGTIILSIAYFIGVRLV